MKITCPACNASYRLPDDRVQGKNKIFKIACKRCGAEIRVRGVETPEEVGRTTLPFALDLPAAMASAAPAVPAQIWFAGIDGKQVGPLTEAEVIDHIQQGRLTGSDLVWRKGFSAWTPTREVTPFDELVSAAPEAAAEPTTPTKRGPRRAQTLELSAAMIELLVKLDGQQAAADAGAPPALASAEPPDLPPLEPEPPPTLVTATPSDKRSDSYSVAGDVAAVAGMAQVETTISAMPGEAQSARSSDARAAEAKRAEQARADAAKAEARAEAARTEATKVEATKVEAAKVEAARTDTAKADAARAEAARNDAKKVEQRAESSIKIRLPEEQTSARDRARPNDGKVALPGSISAGTAKGAADNKTAAKASADGKPAAIPAPGKAPVVTTAKAGTSGTTGAKKPDPAKRGSKGVLWVGGALVATAAVIAVMVSTRKPAEEPVVPPAASADAGAIPAPIAEPPAQPDAAAALQPDVTGAVDPAAATAAATAAGAAADAVVVAKVLEPDASVAADPTAEVKKAEEAKAADEAKTAEEAKKADESKKIDEAKKTDEAKKVDETKKADEAKKPDSAKADDKAAAEAAKRQRAEEGAAKKAAAEAEAKANQGKASEAKQAAAEEAKRKREEAAEAKKSAGEDAKRKKEEAAEAKKAAAEEAAAKRKAEAEAKKLADEAKIAAAAQGKKKPGISDDDVDQILKKHEDKKTGAGAGGAGGGDGALSQSDVSSIGEKAKKKVANCYLLNADDPVEDAIKVQVLVNSTGGIERANVLGKHGSNSGMAKCIADEVKKLVFPVSSGASKKYTLQYRVGG